MNLRASLVMATLGRVAEVDRCVDSLIAQSRRDFELIVVDQNPDDRLVPIVARARSSGLTCHHLRQDEPNQCLARNAGIERASGDIVAFPDDDCWYEADVIEKVLTRFERQQELDGLVVRWFEAGNAPTGRLQFDTFARFRGPVASCITLFFRWERLREAGGFDAALGLHSWYGGGEETDLMLRLLHAGAVVDFDPGIWVHHAVATPTMLAPALMFSRARARARGTGAIYARHSLPGWIVLRGLLSPWLRMLAAVASPRLAVVRMGMGLGRLEGYLGWLLGYRTGGNRCV